MRSYGKLCQAVFALALAFGICLHAPQEAFAMDSAQIEQLKRENGGNVAGKQMFLPTTEQAVAFTFGGFSKTEPLRQVLEKMQENGMRGTFFVTDRELKRNAGNVSMIHDFGQDLAIGIRAEKNGTFASYCNQIETVRAELQRRYGVTTNLARQMSGADDPLLFEAASAMGCQMYGQGITVVQSRHKEAQSVEEIVSNLMGKGITAFQRGGILYIRTDYYTRDDLVADLMMRLKRDKMDNIAYRSYTDTPEMNQSNDSAYRAASIQDILNHQEKMYQYPVNTELLPEEMQPEYGINQVTKQNFGKAFAARYIGAPEVNDYDRMMDFSFHEMEIADQTGIVKTVSDNTIFLTFDDWGMDDSINHLLYVLRKHHVNGTFYIITWNMPNNPNLLRAIAADGNEVGSHTNNHKPMAMTGEDGRIRAAETPEEYAEDVSSAYPKLLSTIGDVTLPNGRYALTRQLRPPTLALNRKGVESIFNAGYDYIVNGYGSTEDYAAVSMQSLVGILNRLSHEPDGKVRRGAILIMHMSTTAKKTARALDIFLGANEKLSDGDPRKFKVGLLGDYLKDGYAQNKKQVPAQ